MPKEKRVKLRQPKENGCTDSLSLFYIFTKVAKALYRSRSLTLSGQILNDLCLIFSDGLSGSDDLSVDIGQADLIIIYQVEGADAGPGQSLAHITAHTADAKHSNLSTCQLFPASFPNKSQILKIDSACGSPLYEIYYSIPQPINLTAYMKATICLK